MSAVAATVPAECGPVVLVDDLDEGVLDPATDRHLRRSLRLASDAPVALTDGAGRWRPARLDSTARRVTMLGETVVCRRPEPEIVVGFAPVKGSRPAWAVQKLTELGVDRILVLAADRSVVRWEAGSGGLDRLERVAREATQQSRRVWLPVVDGLVKAVSALDAGAVLADAGGGSAPSLGAPLLVGPEGGWSDAERAAAGAGTATLGEGVLRTETAAVAAGVALTAIRAGLLVPRS